MHTLWTSTWLSGLVFTLTLWGCGSSGGDTAVDATPDTVTSAGLGIDYGAAPGGPVARYEPESSDFTGTPWPSNRDLGADGRPLFTRFVNPTSVELIDDYLAYGRETLDGFGRNGAVYFQLDAQLDPASLPTPATTMNDGRAIAQLVNVDASSSDYGLRTPIEMRLVDGGSDPYYLGPTVAMRPVYGFPLNDAETYCALLTRALVDSQGRYLNRAAAFDDALESEPSLQPLRAWLADSPLDARDIAAATCFTTQDATKGMRQIQQFLETRPTTGLFDVTYNGATTHFRELTAKYLGPNFQAGEKPYVNTGGELQFDADGDPIVQLDEEIRVRILVPRNATMPEAGWTVVLYSHGTFGDWTSCLSGNRGDILQDGLAMVCIDQPLHGARRHDETREVDYLDTFNVLNPRAGRMSFRQAAADTVWLTRMIADGRFDFASDESGFDEPIKLDPERIVFFGHSHGGLAGALVLGVDPRIKGAVISGAAGILIETILQRTDPLDIKSFVALIAGVTADRIDSFHPLLTMAQMLVDATDPVNYAPYWLKPITGGSSKHLFMTEGTLDHASPAAGAEALAAAGGLPVIEPVVNQSQAHVLRDLAPVSMPVNNNLISETGQLITAGLRQFDGGDHWVALQNEEAQHIWRGFLRAFKTGEVPVIAP